MNKIKDALNKILAWLKALRLRKPSSRYALIGLSGNALMIWTPTGNVVLTTDTARMLSRNLDRVIQKTEDANVL